MMNRRRLVLPMCVVVALIALFAVPDTRWVAWSLIHSEFDCARSISESEKIVRTARRHPDDIDAQIAGMLYSGVETEVGIYHAVSVEAFLPALDRLLITRPGYVPLYAHMLRMMMYRDVKLHRKEAGILNHLTPEPIPARTSYDAENLQKFDRLAAQGERFDPDNAYFPAMRFVGLLEAHRDDEALGALHRAASRPRWNAYATPAIRAAIRMQTEGPARGPGPYTLFAQMTTLTPHFAQLRKAANTVIYC